MREVVYEEVPGLVGKTLTAVTRGKTEKGCPYEWSAGGEDLLTFVEEDGSIWRMYYSPDCCATCAIEDIAGDLQDLVGSPLVLAEEASNNESDRERCESETWSFYRFATAKGYVTIRWYGSSNGYYSESPSFVKETAQ